MTTPDERLVSLRLQADEADAELDEAAGALRIAQDRFDRAAKLSDALKTALELLTGEPRDRAGETNVLSNPQLQRQLSMRYRDGGAEEVAERLALELPEGRLPVTMVARWLETVGDYASRQSAYATAYSTLDRSDRFAKVGRGEFQLNEARRAVHDEETARRARMMRTRDEALREEGRR